MKRSEKRSKSLLWIGALLLAVLIPADKVRAQLAIPHPFDDAALLMISSQMRLDGEVQSALLLGGRTLAPSRQTAIGNEIDVLIQLYSDQITKLRVSDNYDPDLEAKLINQLEKKVDALHQQAQELANRRNRGRGGFFGFLGRAVKSLGQATGWLMGKAMDGAGKVAEFAIEDVAPQVLKEALQNGAPLSAALVRRVARELLINRVADAITRDQQKRAVGLPPVEVEVIDDLLGAFEEQDKSGSFQGDLESGEILETNEEQVGPVVTYEFSLADLTSGNTTFHPGDFGYRLMDPEHGCWEGQQDLDFLSIVLHFDTQAMTASGTISGQTQEIKYSEPSPYIDQYLALDGSGGFTMTFSDIPATPYGEYGWEFSGFGTADLNYGGTLGCAYWDSVNDEMIYLSVNDQLSSTGISSDVYFVVDLSGSGASLDLLSSGEVEHPENLGLYYLVEFVTDQPIDLPAP